MMDFVIISILLLIVGGAIFYIIKAKKKGARCIGCPMSGSCGKASCDCSSVDNTK